MTTSVLIATYNGEKYIIEQLESIMLQSKQPDEVIICDDCSSDCTVDIVKEFIKKNNLSTWVIYENGTNLGWKNNFAKLISIASKDILFFCDQDDIWCDTKIELMSKALENNREIKLLVSDYRVLYSTNNTEPIKMGKLKTAESGHLLQKPKWARIQRPGCVYATDRVFAQEFFEKHKHDGFAHDLMLWEYSFNNDVIGYIKEPLTIWRRHESAATGSIIESRKEYRIKENRLFLESMIATTNGETEASGTVQRIISLEKKRNEFFKSKKLCIWLSCFKYLDCYLKKRTWLADLLYIKI